MMTTGRTAETLIVIDNDLVTCCHFWIYEFKAVHRGPDQAHCADGHFCPEKKCAMEADRLTPRFPGLALLQTLTSHASLARDQDSDFGCWHVGE